MGSHLVNSLLRDGHSVSVLDNFSTSRAPRVIENPNLNYINGSVLDEPLIDAEINETDQVFHLAAAVGVSNIMESPLRGLETNVLGSEIVIRNCSKFEKPLILTSSSEIYGKNNSDYLGETSDRIVGVPQISRWSYSDSKAIEEAFAFAYMRERGLKVKIVRLFNTVGPGQLGQYGMVIPKMIKSAISNQDVVVHGSGEQTRCFMHVQDAVNGLKAVLNSNSADGQVYNLGNPQEISINQLALKIIKMAKSTSRIVHKSHSEIFGDNFEDMEKRIPDIRKAKVELHWEPEKSLDEILKDILINDFCFEESSLG